MVCLAHKLFDTPREMRMTKQQQVKWNEMKYGNEPAKNGC